MTPPDGGRRVVVLPGRTFGPSVPQLFLPMFAALRRGAEPDAVEWQDGTPLPEVDPGARAAWVEAQVRARLAGAEPRSTVVIGKSLGSYAAGVVAEHGLPAVWVTPLLTDPVVVAGLRRATAPFLLVGGTADDVWDGPLARSLTPHVLEVAGADHGLFVPGPLRDSAAVLGHLADASEAFLDAQVWP